MSGGNRKYRQRRHGLYKGVKGGKRVLIEAAGHCTRPIEVRPITLTDFTKEAAYRKTTPEALLAKVLDYIANDDLFAAVLDD